MNSLFIDLILCAIAYVILIYFIATMVKARSQKGKDNNDDGDGGIENLTPPTIDLPPGIIWPKDAPKKKSTDMVDV
jgi:hypothetical protein